MKRPALSDADAMLLAASVRLLGAARVLTELDVVGNKLTNDGVAALMTALAATPARKLRVLRQLWQTRSHGSTQELSTVPVR